MKWASITEWANDPKGHGTKGWNTKRFHIASPEVTYTFLTANEILSKLNSGIGTDFTVSKAVEFDMREPVKKWLLSMGYLSAVEFWLHSCGPTDIVAGKYFSREGRSIPKLDKTIAVELKVSNIGEAISQALSSVSMCNCAYIAMPKSVIDCWTLRSWDKVRGTGLGLVSLGDNFSAKILVPPREGKGINPRSARVAQLWRRVRKDWGKLEGFYGTN